MATEFSQDALLRFLRSRGGSAKNSDLLLHFGNFLRGHVDQNRNRELFKQFVNSVATVRQEDGVSYVSLRKRFRGQVPGGGQRGSAEPRPSPHAAGRRAEPPPGNAAPSPARSARKPLLEAEMLPAPAAATAEKTILPAAGILLNNNNNNSSGATNMNPGPRQQTSTAGPGRPAAPVSPIPQRSEQPAPGQRLREGQTRAGLGPPAGTAPAHQTARSRRPPRGREARLQTERGLRQGPLPHLGLQPPGPPRRMRYRPSYKTAVSYDDDGDDGEGEEEEEEELRRGSIGGRWAPANPLSDTLRPISASSPSIVDPHGLPTVFSSSSSSSSSERRILKVSVQGPETKPPGGPGRSMQSGVWPSGQWAGPELEPVSGPVRTTGSLPLDEERYIPSSAHSHHVGVPPEPRQGRDQRQGAWLPSSQSGIFSPSSYESASGHQRSFGSPKGPGLNHEDPPAGAGATVGGSQIQEATQPGQGKESVDHSAGHLHDDQEAAAGLVPFHGSSDRLHAIPWHLSTGDLDDRREEAESSEGSTSSQTRPRPAGARRLSSRMCRSLGTDLDQLLQEEARVGGGSEMARLNRLHLISSSLSLRYDLSSSSSLSSCCTPPRCPSPAHPDEGANARGRSPPTASPPAQREGPSRQSLVPLEPREHAWMVKGAAGAWPDIYTMFREDSSLLNKQDFISGFTVLHWIAKHGDHRVLNTLWYGVQKAGLMFDINAKSTCGHTPLHVAAIHNSKNVLRLLVTNFNADVTLRDMAGKKPWQYLGGGAPPDVLQLLGAPPRPAGGGEARGVGAEDHDPVRPQRQRRRHHLSFASQGERPPVMTGTTRVKRSSSIAAFLKHKSLQRFYGHQADSSV
nr:LOW QUALITY PROTEIN: ankyrin repeat domain-containing protein SOWAHB-like [Gasterosteus aculeatus aculeatus]